jgi:hypothetical protein
MTVGDLKRVLSLYQDSDKVILSKTYDGEFYSELCESAPAFWHKEQKRAYDTCVSHKEVGMEKKEWNKLRENLPSVCVLFPENENF